MGSRHKLKAAPFFVLGEGEGAAVVTTQLRMHVLPTIAKKKSSNKPIKQWLSKEHCAAANSKRESEAICRALNFIENYLKEVKRIPSNNEVRKSIGCHLKAVIKAKSDLRFKVLVNKYLKTCEGELVHFEPLVRSKNTTPPAGKIQANTQNQAAIWSCDGSSFLKRTIIRPHTKSSGSFSKEEDMKNEEFWSDISCSKEGEVNEKKQVFTTRRNDGLHQAREGSELGIGNKRAGVEIETIRAAIFGGGDWRRREAQDRFRERYRGREAARVESWLSREIE